MSREDIKDCEHHRGLRSQIVEMPGAYLWKTLALFCSRRNPLCSSRHVLDDTSGRSSEVDGKGLQRSRFGKDDTLHEARYSKCRLCLKCQSGFSSLFPFRSEIKAKHLPPTFLQVKKNTFFNLWQLKGSVKQNPARPYRSVTGDWSFLNIMWKKRPEMICSGFFACCLKVWSFRQWDSEMKIFGSCHGLMFPPKGD